MRYETQHAVIEGHDFGADPTANFELTFSFNVDHIVAVHIQGASVGAGLWAGRRIHCSQADPGWWYGASYLDKAYVTIQSDDATAADVSVIVTVAGKE